MTADASKMARMMARMMDFWWAVSLVEMKAASLVVMTADGMVRMMGSLLALSSVHKMDEMMVRMKDLS